MRFELGEVTGEQVVGYFQTSTRISRAVQILDNVKPDAPDIYLVRSASKPKICYVTDLRDKTCSCPDWTFRAANVSNFKCKHLLAVELKERLEEQTVGDKQ